MNVAVINPTSPRKECINKDFMAGYGWAFNAGESMRARLINIVKKRGETVPLMSLGYIASIFESLGHRVTYSENQIPKAEIAFISSSMVDFHNEIQWATRLTSANIKVYFIGMFASEKPELFLPYCHGVIQGEPESVCYEIAGGDLTGGIRKSPAIRDLDSLPFPLWNIFPHKTFSYIPALRARPFFPILSSRGCAFSCEYCPYPEFYAYRNRSVENIIEEIKHLVNRYDMKGILFRDPLFSGNRKRARQIAESIILNNLNIRWVCETRLDLLNEKLLDLFYRSGCRVINVGIESADSSILQNVDRREISSDQQKNIVDYADRIGIRITAFYVLGLEGETVQTAENTIAYAKWLNTFAAQFFVNTPFPGTTGYEKLKHKLANVDWQQMDCYTPVVDIDSLSSYEISSLKEKAFVSYYYRYSYLTGFVRRVGRALITG